MTATTKKIVTDLMRMAVAMRHAPAQTYDAAYKKLQNALYELIEPPTAGGAGWIGVDLDCTIAVYPPDNGQEIGTPIAPMVSMIRAWLAKGVEVRIFTARASLPDQVMLIKKWCREHIGQELEVTNKKDFQMVELWDDRAVRVIPNTGRRCCHGS